jgi:hypothetical protein
VTSAGALTIYATLDQADIPTSWRVRVGSVDQVLHAGNAFTYPRALAELDVDGDGLSEWLIKTFDLAGHGTNWQQLGLFVLRGGRLRQVRSEGEPFAVRVGGISRMGEGAACRDGAFVLMRAVARDRQNVRWEYSERTFRLAGSMVEETGRTDGILHLTDYNDPKLDPYYAIHCHGFSYP